MQQTLTHTNTGTHTHIYMHTGTNTHTQGKHKHIEIYTHMHRNTYIGTHTQSALKITIKRILKVMPGMYSCLQYNNLRDRDRKIKSSRLLLSTNKL